MTHIDKLPAQINDQPILDRIRDSEPKLGEEALLNGGKLLTAEVKDPTSSSVAVIFDAGSRREAPGEFGTLHFFEHLPPASFRLVNDTDLHHFAGARSWKFHINITNDRVMFGFTCPNYDTNEALHALRSMFQGSEERYQKVFDVEKGRILNEIDLSTKNAGSVRYNFLQQLLTSGSGYAHPIIGYKPQVAEYTFEDVVKMGRRFLTPDNATFIISGDGANITQARDVFEQLTLPGTNLEKGAVSLKPDITFSQVPNKTVVASELFPGVDVSAVLPGMPREVSPEREALTAAVELLSNKVNSRISNELGLTYGAQLNHWGYQDFGFVVTTFSTDPKNVDAATGELEALLEKLPSLVTDKYLAERYVRKRNAYYLSADHRNFGYTLESKAVDPHVPVQLASQDMALTKTLTPAMVKTAAEKYLHPGHIKYLFLGSEDALRAAGLELTS